MRRILIVAIAAMLLAQTVDADTWAHRHRRTLIALGISAGTATIAGIGLSKCRATGVEKCTGKYGAAWGIYGAGVGINTAMIISSDSCWSNHSNAVCYGTAYGGSALQLALGIRQWTLAGPANTSEERMLTRLGLKP